MSNNTTVINPFYSYVNEWTKHGASIFVSLSFVLGIPGNILVLLVHKNIKEKTVTDWMIFYIAVCDIMSLLNAPLYVCQFQGYWLLGFPNFLCKYHYTNLNSVTMAAYIFTACTAVERLAKVVFSKEIFSTTVAKYVWIPVFLVSFGMGSLTIWTVNNNANNYCMYNVEGWFLATIEYALVFLTAFISSIIMTACYIKIGMFLIKKMREMSSATFAKSYRNTVHTTKMLAIVTVVFLFSANVPHVVVIALTINEPTKEPEMSVTIFLGLTFFINNFFNPILYMGMNETFRKRVKHLFRVCCSSRYAPSEEGTGSSRTATTVKKEREENVMSVCHIKT